MSPDIHLTISLLSFRIDHNNRAGEFSNQGHQGKPQNPDSTPSVLGYLPRIQTAAGFSAYDHLEQRPSEALRSRVLPSRTRSEPSI